MREISILGSTGSIGTSALDVISRNQDKFNVVGLSCNANLDLLVSQIRKFKPKTVSVGQGLSSHLKSLLSGMKHPPDIFEDSVGHEQVAIAPQNGLVVAAMVGAAGIRPVLAGIRKGNDIALANKEALVLAGSLLIREAENHRVRILPIDSEHNAIFQSLRDEKKSSIAFITLTASGGPFLNTPFEEFSKIKLNDALNHPNWDMGEKITIDSATMMNKCLEIIEAKWLFNLDPDRIKVVIHPQSIIHSMVTFTDGSTICQMGVPDMRTPISYCLGYPDRILSGSEFLEFSTISQLTFQTPDRVKFPAVDLAYESLKLGGGAPAALNGANEVLVAGFLKEQIHFTDISRILVSILSTIRKPINEDLGELPEYIKSIKGIDDALSADQWGRKFAESSLERAG